MVTVIAMGPAKILGSGLFFRVHGFPSCSDSYFALFSHTFVDTFSKGELTFFTSSLTHCDLKRVSGRELAACGEGEASSCTCSSLSSVDTATLTGLSLSCSGS